jgi:hypothetical protein
MSDDIDLRQTQRRLDGNRRGHPRFRTSDGALVERRKCRRRRYICMRGGSPIARPITFRKPVVGLGRLS